MQINDLTGNIMDLRVGKGSSGNLFAQQNGNAVKTNAGSVFGPQCKVTISREGRKLSEQMKEPEPKSFTAAGTERMLLRQQRQDEMNKSEQSDTLSEISSLMSSIKNSYAAGEDKETIQNKQEALNRLLDLKARQEEENEQRLKDAAGSAAGASKDQEEIDRKNADLYLMLKSFEEQEKDDQEGNGGLDAENDSAAADEDQGSVSDQFQESAAMLGASAAKRELQAKGMINDMFDSGYGRLAEADAMMHEIQAELDLAAESLNQANLSDDERNQLMSEHIERAYNMMQGNYGEMMNLRRKGHQEIQDAKELELRHIEINPLDGVDKAKQAIMDAGVAAAFQELSQGALDKASEELEERVRDALDRRNDVVSDPNEDEEQEKAEKTEEEENARELEEQGLEQEEFEKKSKIMN